jgi:hypothetical protein
MWKRLSMIACLALATACSGCGGPGAGDESAGGPSYKGRTRAEWIALLGDETDRNRRMAFGALVSMGEDAYGGAADVARHLDDPDLEVRDGAVRVLGVMGPVAVEARPALEAEAARVDSLLGEIRGMDRRSADLRDRLRASRMNLRLALEKVGRP